MLDYLRLVAGVTTEGVRGLLTAHSRQSVGIADCEYNGLPPRLRASLSKAANKSPLTPSVVTPAE